jgi:type II secretion system protein H
MKADFFTNYEQRTANSAGFTLVEIMLVVVLIALLAGVAGALYGGTLKRMAVERSARELLLAAKYARMAAVEEQRPSLMNFDEHNGRFYVSMIAIDANSGQRIDTAVRNPYSRPVQMPEGVRFETIRVSSAGQSDYQSGEQKTIWFGPDGTGESAVIIIGNGTSHATISISGATGRARLMLERVDDPNSDVYDMDFAGSER